jgi:hypothetical protein
MWSALLMAGMHMGGFIYVAYPFLGERVWPESFVVQHHLVGVASALGVLGPLLSIVGLSLRVQQSFTTVSFGS